MKRTNPENHPQIRAAGKGHPRLLAVAALALALVATQARAAPGDLDPSFGDHGRARVGSAGSSDPGPGRIPVAQQADGRILVAARNPDGSVSVTRLKPDGTSDAAFGTSGTARVDFGANGPATIRAIAIAADGRILIAGHVVIDSRSGARDIAVARLTPSGSLDGTFGNGGKVTFDLRAGADDTANAMVIQSDGRIALAGSSADAADSSSVALARLMPDGAVDASFGTAGRAFLGTKNSGATAYGLVMQADGKLVGCGTIPDFEVGPLAIAFRLMSDGTPDPEFGNAGLIGVDSGAAYDCAVRPDGRLLLATGHFSYAMVSQLTADGKQDRAFGKDGAVYLPFACDLRCIELGYDEAFGGPRQSATDVLLLSDGGLIVAGLNPGGDLALARMDPTGNRVAVFGRTGSLFFDLGHDSLAASLTGASVLLQPDGRLVAAGAGNVEPTVVRILMDDSPGTSVVGFVQTKFDWYELIDVEQDAPPGFMLRRTGGTSGTVSVDVTFVNGTARSPEDFVANGRTVTWADGDGQDKFVYVTLVGDQLAESPEEFRLVLSNPGGAGIAAGEATVTLRDSPAGGFGFADESMEFYVDESKGSATLQVQRLGGLGGAVSVQYRTVERNPGAKAGADFTATSGTLSWGHGDNAPKSIVIPIMQDSQSEGLETFQVLLELPTGGASLIAARQTTVVTIFEPGGVAPKPATSSGGNGGGGGGGGSTGPSLLALLALLMICARRRKAQLSLAARH